MSKPEKHIPEFLDRIENPQNYPVLRNEDGSFSTHSMAAEVDENGQWWVFPTIVPMGPNGELYRFEDPYVALEYNKRTKNALPQTSQKTALDYSRGYKKGTPLETFKPWEF